MKYIASVREYETNDLKIIEREYDNKQDFIADLRANGYKVRFVTTEENFDKDCIKYNNILEKQRLIYSYKHK